MALMRTLKKRLTRCFSRKPPRTQRPPIFRSGWAEKSIGATYYYPFHPKLRLQAGVMPIIEEEKGEGGVDVGVEMEVDVDAEEGVSVSVSVEWEKTEWEKTEWEKTEMVL